MSDSNQNRFIYVQLLVNTPLAPIGIAVLEGKLIAIEFVKDVDELMAVISNRYEKHNVMISSDIPLGVNKNLLSVTGRQITEYFSSSRKTFDLPLEWGFMTPFQEQALRATFAIPYGTTATYQEIANKIARPKAARAVGRAEALNPMPIVIPCHRVIGSDGGLHGYGGRGGLETKAWLLQLESNYA